MNYRDQLINSLCDLKGYSTDDFTDKETLEIISDLTPQEHQELENYSGLKLSVISKLA